VPDIARRAGLSTLAVIGALGALDLDGVVREREAGWLRATWRRGRSTPQTWKTLGTAYGRNAL